MQALPEIQPEAVYAGATLPPEGTASRARRAGFIIVALLIYRIVEHIPIPLATIFHGTGPFSHHYSVLALGLWPYIVASIFMQLLIWLAPGLGRKVESGAGRRQIGLYIRLLTLPVAVLRAGLLIRGLSPLMVDPSVGYKLALIAALTAGTMFLVWLSDRITAQGLVDGVLLILFADIVADLPHRTLAIYQYVQAYAIPIQRVIAMGALMFGILAGVVFVELARRRIPVHYPDGKPSYLSLKINSAGVLPPLFSALFLGLIVSSGRSLGLGPEAFNALIGLFSPGRPLYEAAKAAIVIFFAFSFATFFYDPLVAAGNLKKRGGFIPGYQPGQRTADYISHILTRITAIGAVYLIAVCLLPVILWLNIRDLPFNFGGFSLLAVVIASLDILRRFRPGQAEVPADGA